MRVVTLSVRGLLLLPVAVLLVLSLAPVAARAAGEDPQAAFNALFPDAKVRGTKEDLDWARKILAAASTLKDDAPLRRLCYDKAYALASPQADGALTAVLAMESLAAEFPDDKARADEQARAVIEKFYPTSRGTAREQLAPRYLRRLTEQADAKLAANRSDEAMALYKKALPVAKVVGPDEAQAVEEAQQRCQARQALDRKVLGLRARVQADPSDQAALKEMVLLLVLDLDAPDEAARWGKNLADEALRGGLAAAAKPFADATEAEMLELGAWYAQLARGAAGTGKLIALVRSKAYYLHYLAVHTASDADRLKARTALEQTDKALAGLDPSPAEVRRLMRRYQPPAPTRDPQVADAIKNLVDRLYKTQNEQGHWESGSTTGFGSSQYGLATARAVYALLLAGEDPAKSPKLDAAIKYLADRNNLDQVAPVAMRISALGAVGDGTRFRPRMQKDADLLLHGMSKHGMFSDSLKSPSSYFYMSASFAGWVGLASAADHGVEPPAKAWLTMMQTVMQCQLADGGWDYNPPSHVVNPGWIDRSPHQSNAQMTCAVVAMLKTATVNTRDAAARKAAQKSIDGGLKWLDDNMEKAMSQYRGDYIFMDYLQAVGRATGRKTFGSVDWYAEGAKHITGQARFIDNFSPIHAANWLVFLARGPTE